MELHIKQSNQNKSLKKKVVSERVLVGVYK